jgi:hypothetical protein
MKKFTKKQIAFLSRIESNMVEPWATIASDAILWNNHFTLKDLEKKFKELKKEIYGAKV